MSRHRRHLSTTVDEFCTLITCFNPVNPIGLENITWKFYFVYIAILVAEVIIIYFFFVETKGPTLEEIARLFDGDQANVSGKEIINSKAQETEAYEVEDTEKRA